MSNYENDQYLMSNSEIRELAREQLSGRWGECVVAALVFLVIGAALQFIPLKFPLPFLGGETFFASNFDISIFSFLLSGALSIGYCIFHLNFIRNKNPEISNLFDGFQQLAQAIIASVLIGIITGVGFLLLIVPGVIAMLGLSQTYFIMADDLGISGIDAMKESWEIMDGHKTQLFFMHLSFIPWAILCVFTLFIGLLWLYPYIFVSLSNFYVQLIGDDADLDIEDHLIDD